MTEPAASTTADRIVRCPICGSELRESEGIQPPRLVCSRRACEGEVWP